MKYVVKNGDTLSGIGARYHVDWHKIASANHISPPYIIRAGQTIEIPTAGSSGVVVSNPQPYHGQPIIPPKGSSGSTGSTSTNGGIITTPQNSGSGSTATNIISMAINGIILYGIFKVLMKAL